MENSMTDTDDTKRAGLGKVIYSVDDKKAEASPEEKNAEEREVEKAVEESFPASDPPGFNKGAASDPT
jgi:hypothetical protein